MGIPIDVEGPVTAEIFTVARIGEGLVLTGPCGPAPWLIETGGGEHPLDAVRRIVTGALDGVRLLHSTSWRFEKGAVILSFVVVIEADAIGTMDTAPIGRVGLARSTTHEPPKSIEGSQVLEHGLRHLSWLAKEDQTVKETLDEGWHLLLSAYMPQPFQQLTEAPS